MIKAYLSKFDLDIRKTGDARFMDQKCTPDVVCIIADCIVNFVGTDVQRKFTVNDIWTSQYFIKNVKEIFNKPLATDPTTRSEYDKFIQQPLRMLAYAHILSIEKQGNTNLYSIENLDILEYVALKDRNAYLFLCDYLEEVLKDSGLYRFFEEYKSAYENGVLDANKFNDLKNRYQKFIIGNTNINGTVEVNRIFPKVLNVYAVQNNLLGTLKGRLSPHEFSYVDLMYNRKNWRDVKKSKGLSRQDAEHEYDELISETENPYSEYLIQKAMTIIRKLYTESEVKDQWGNGEATQVHHIFPKHLFPQLAHYLENLIKLTATQHVSKAHPSNKTKDIDIDYQLICLLAKANSIEQSLRKNQVYYRKESFVHCINVGLKSSLDSSISFRALKAELAAIYNDR